MTFEREPVRAPALKGLAWLNVAEPPPAGEPLRWEGLKGKLVLLDFWTYGCINCLHVLDELRAIEAEFAGEPLIVIGIHSAKFTNEQEVEHVRAAVARYDIRHPVLIDDHMAMWQAYSVRGWPTLVLVDPEGYLIGTVSGEGHGPQLAKAIAAALKQLRAELLVDDRPTALAPIQSLLAEATIATAPLRFPGKVLADAQQDRLFIADSGNHRLVVTTLAGEQIATIGTGQPGAQDGDFASATFRTPQGMALAGNLLYVADTGNHLIRRVDLAAETVVTIAGTSAQNRARLPQGPALATPLNSPWDLVLDGTTLWIAMAGQHQIWSLDLADMVIHVAAGRGSEARLDGAAAAACFAQPSGLALDTARRRLYIADSEASAIRVISDLDAPSPDRSTEAEPFATGGPQVATVAGGDLFEFGLRDGAAEVVRFQHPLGVAFADGMLYITDTYNHAIRRVDLASGVTRTVAGAAESGLADGRGRDARFFEPGGLSLTDTMIYVADTNNHAIRRIDRQTGDTTTLVLSGVCAPGFCLP